MRMAYALGLGVLVLGGCRSEGHRQACMDNLKALGNALAIYANENFDLLPTDERLLSGLELHAALVKAGHLTPNQTRCPHAPPDRAAYIHLPGAPPAPGGRIDPRSVLVYEHPDNHGGGGLNVLFADSHCEYMTVEAFEEVLAETKR